MTSKKDLAAQLEFPLEMGIEKQFDRVFRLYHQPLKHFAGSYIDRDDAEDVIENLFLALFDKNRRFSNGTELKGFLYLSVRNACLNHIRNASNAHRHHMAIASGMPEGEPGFIAQMIRAEVLGEIYREVQKLPSQCSKVIELSFFEGLSNSEIAERLDISEKTVRNTKSRGLSVLKENLSGQALAILLLLSEMACYQCR